MSTSEITIEEATLLFQETVAELLADGCSVAAGQLLLANADDPVFHRLIQWVRVASDEQLDAWHNEDFKAVSGWLDISVELLEEYLPYDDVMIAVEVQYRRGIDARDPSDEVVLELLEAWLESFGDGRLFDPARPEIQYVRRDEESIGSASAAPAIPRAQLAPILRKAPTNAWLLVGSNASFLTQTELAELRDNPEARIEWTCPRQIQLGDLVFIYYIAPRKSVQFMARAASDPVFHSSIQVNADNPVDPHQWWVQLSDIREIPAVPYAELLELMDGHLVLRGKPSHYLAPRVVAGLKRIIGDEHEVKLPVGKPELPDPATVTFDQWKTFSTGTLNLELQIEQYVVEPLLRLALENHATAAPQRAMRLPVGVPDYVVNVGNKVTCAVEVKVGVRAPADEDWKRSPEVHQTLRYMRHLDTPGVLIDANLVFFLNRDADEPHRVVERRNMTEEELAELGRHLTAPRQR